MTTVDPAPPPDSQADWPLRTVVLAVAGAVVGACVGWLVKDSPAAPTAATRWAITVFLLVAGISTALLVERHKIASSLAFALVAGALAAMAMYRIVGFGLTPSQGPDGYVWPLLSALIAIGLALPLFASWRQIGLRGLPQPLSWPYPYIHERAWASTILWFAGWAFVLLVILLVVLLANLFALIGLTRLEKLLDVSWFLPMFGGAAFGAAVGMLRDRERVLGVLKTLVHRVLSAVTVPVALGLAAFVVALFFTGLTPLWEATKSTTPLMLVAAIIAILLVNVTIGDEPAHESRAWLLRAGATLLAVLILPLAAIALVSVNKRMAQYGLTPDRIWAVIFIVVICGYALSYLGAVLWRRAGWPATVRRCNLALAVAVCVVAALLATPLLDFGAWSTRNQMARLSSGEVAPRDFDWGAMAVDFGPAGRTQLQQLADHDSNSDIRAAAKEALQYKNRYEARRALERRELQQALAGQLQIIPAKVALPEALGQLVTEQTKCVNNTVCHLYYMDGAAEALLIRVACTGCRVEVIHFKRDGTAWEIASAERAVASASIEQENAAVAAALAAGNVQIRSVERRQLVVGDQPLGAVLE